VTMPDPRRKQLRMLAMRITRIRRWSVEVVDLAASKLRWTCKTCGWSQVRVEVSGPKRNGKHIKALSRPVNPVLLAKLARYWSDPNSAGCTGRCARCTKQARDEAYPGWDARG